MLRDCFVEYCRSCFCEESVLFLLDVIHFKSEAAKGLNGQYEQNFIYPAGANRRQMCGYE
jgi:hypothetical protein